MTKVLKNASLWSAVLTLIYLIVKNWIGIDVPAWDDISVQIVTVLTIIFGI